MSAAARRYGANNNGRASGKNAGKYKNKMKIRKIGVTLKNFLIAVFIIILTTAIFLILTNQYFFKIKNIRISENDKYSYEDILKASGITAGEELYGIDVKKAKANIKEMLTYAESVNIMRIPPSTVNIDIKTEKGFFGVMLGGDYYIISKNFRVIDKISVVGSSESDFEPPDGIITFETDAIKKCYIGEKIEFSDGDISDTLKEMTKLLETGDDDVNMLSSIQSINITNKFKVVMNYGGRFLVKFGIFENMSSKILSSFEIINQLPDYAEGIIDMTDSKVASFRYDENVSNLYNLSKTGAFK